MRVERHNYRYFPYELDLAHRELETVLRPQAIRDIDGGFEIERARQPGQAHRLVYFSGFSCDNEIFPTTQALLESVNGNGRRQSTRYSVHGVHEYKGKFNPQVARALFNILITRTDEPPMILDPFCGSGTSLVEAAHAGLRGVGLDSNPFAVFLANAKIATLHASPDLLEAEARRVASVPRPRNASASSFGSEARAAYLARWFDADTHSTVDGIRQRILRADPSVQPTLLALASNLLRDYSLQDPTDLRIRRRKTPPPSVPFEEQFRAAVVALTAKLRTTQSILGTTCTRPMAVLGDARAIHASDVSSFEFGLAITSPPYATALPYIDTQRLSIVWLELAEPEDIPVLDSLLIGSRESRGSRQRQLAEQMQNNLDHLPDEQWRFCVRLYEAIGESDGFRRRAVPMLLYRYFASMRDSFKSVRAVMTTGSPYALVVGGNHTTLGGNRFDIDTPHHLAELACSAGWSLRETHRLQTYQRYGYHTRNAVRSEALVLLEAR